MTNDQTRKRSIAPRGRRRIGLALLLGVTIMACAQQNQPAKNPSPVAPTAPNQPPAASSSPQTSWTPLFNGRDFGGWYTWLPSSGKNSDPKGVFKVENGALHVLDLPESNVEQEFGYLATNGVYANYELRLQYKWGTRKFAPRENQPRDAGVVYNAQGPDAIWPGSAEFQIKEGETGDLWLLEGTNLSTTVEDTDAGTDAETGDDEVQYAPLGKGYTSDNPQGGYLRLIKDGDFEKPGWNDLTLIVSGDQAAQIVNGNVTVRGSGLRAPDGSSLRGGRILLQAEGAEVFYRNIELRPLAYTPPPSGATVLFGGSDTSRWQNRGGGFINWPVNGGAMQVLPSSNLSNAIRTKDGFTDFRLHLEFKVPITPTDLSEQERGNSGVYLQGRYELQILDSFGRALDGKNDAGAIYGQRDASSNAALPADTWQSYDVQFRAARWQGGQKTENARVSAWLNGEKVQDNVELAQNTFLGDAEAPTPGPIVLQDHGNKVQFRNIWIVPQP